MLRSPATQSQTLGAIRSNTFFHLRVHFWALWTITYFIPRCDKTSEPWLYIPMKCLWHSLCIYFTSTIAKWIIKSIKLNSSGKPPYHEFKYTSFNVWRSPRKIFPDLIRNQLLFLQSWTLSNNVFVQRAYVEEYFVSRSFEINFPIMNWIRIKQGLCSEDTCGGSNDL